MKPSRQLFLHLGAGAATLIVVSALVLALSGSGVWSQAARTIKLVVPFPPGGAIDVLARIVAEQVGKLQGPAIVIENRPGAGTEIGTDAVVRAKPDGSTLLMGSDASLVVPHMRKVAYDFFTDLIPICSLASVPTVIVVNKDSPYRTIDALLQAARAKPGDLTYGSAPGSVLNVGFEMLAHAANFRMTFIPFGGTPPAVNALLGGHIDAAMVDYPAAAGQLRSGALRALATGAPKRIEDMPDVPTVAESGYKDYELELWYGPFAPAKTPGELIAQLQSWFTQATQAPEVKTRLAALQFSPTIRCGADFAAFLRKRSDDFGRAIREAKIKAE
jgi:tripartite-type tricarboxylate transporter receptor subunit TctC